MPSPDARPPLTAQADLCECCRRPRADLAIGAPCPECGVRPSGLPPIPFQPAEPPTLTCSACGYSIEQLNPNGRCPECGLEIEVTLQGDGLHLADPRYLSRVARGQGWIMWTAVLFLLSIVPGLCIPPLLVITLITSPITMATGVWLLCHVDARFPEDAGKRSPAQLARIAAFATVGTELLTLLLGGVSAGIWDSADRGGDESLVPAAEISALITLVGLLVTLVFLTEHMRRTGIRMRDKPLPRWSRISAFSWVLCGVFELTYVAVDMFDPESAPAFMVLLVPAAFFGAFCGAVAVSRLGRAVRAAIARQTTARLAQTPPSKAPP